VGKEANKKKRKKKQLKTNLYDISLVWDQPAAAEANHLVAPKTHIKSQNLQLLI